MSSIRTVVETFIRLVKSELDTHAVLVASDNIFEVTRVPSIILQGPKLIENSARRTFAKVVDKETAILTYQQSRHPLLYNLDFDVIATAGHEGDLLDLHQKVARFYQHNPSLVVSNLGSLPIIEETPLGGLQRVNLSNLRQSSGRCRIADCPVYDGSIEHGSLIVDRVFEFRGGVYEDRKYPPDDQKNE